MIQEIITDINYNTKQNL